MRKLREQRLRRLVREEIQKLNEVDVVNKDKLRPLKTAMQELIDKLNNVKPTQYCSIETIRGWSESLLEKEKEQLERAWQDGAETAQNDAAKEIRKNYTPNKL